MAKKSAPSINVATATMAQLLAFHNEHAVVPTKRFSTRAAAEKRVTALIADIAANAAVDAPKAKKAKGEKAAPSGDRSAAIAASWADKAVAAARAARHAVSVDGTEYRSVAAAFTALGLPMGVHIRFRGQLKAAGKMAFSGHNFKIVPAAAAAKE